MSLVAADAIAVLSVAVGETPRSWFAVETAGEELSPWSSPAVAFAAAAAGCDGPTAGELGAAGLPAAAASVSGADKLDSAALLVAAAALTAASLR